MKWRFDVITGTFITGNTDPSAIFRHPGGIVSLLAQYLSSATGTLQLQFSIDGGSNWSNYTGVSLSTSGHGYTDPIDHPDLGKNNEVLFRVVPSSVNGTIKYRLGRASANDLFGRALK